MSKAAEKIPLHAKVEAKELATSKTGECESESE